jgi:hypothetical protein
MFPGILSMLVVMGPEPCHQHCGADRSVCSALAQTLLCHANGQNPVSSGLISWSGRQFQLLKLIASHLTITRGTWLTWVLRRAVVLKACPGNLLTYKLLASTCPKKLDSETLGIGAQHWVLYPGYHGILIYTDIWKHGLRLINTQDHGNTW